MSFAIEAAAARGGAMDGYPKLRGFLDRIHARPAGRATAAAETGATVGAAIGMTQRTLPRRKRNRGAAGI